MGEGFTWETQDKARDIAAARAGWDKARELIRDPDIRMVLLDEINIALRYDYLDIAEVVAFLRDEKPPMTHVVLTGRNAKPELIELADLVTASHVKTILWSLQAKYDFVFVDLKCEDSKK